jgi:hypothetical protein
LKESVVECASALELLEPTEVPGVCSKT